MANTRFKIENGLTVSGGNTILRDTLEVNANTYVRGDLLFVSGDFFIGGNLQYTNTSIAGDLVPTANGIALGNTGRRFEGFFVNISVSGTATPTANGGSLGTTTNRWFAYTTNIDATGQLTLAGNVAVNTNALVVDAANKRVGVNMSPAGSNTLSVNGPTFVNGAIVVNGSITSVGGLSSNGTSVAFGNAAIYSNTATGTTGNITIDGFATSLGRAAKMFIYVDAGNTVVHSIEMMLLHEGTNVLVTKYAEIFNSSLGTFDANILSGNVVVTFTPTTTGSYTVKTIRQQML